MLNYIKALVNRFLGQMFYSGQLLADLTGQVVVITGASRGIGKATAEVLYREGANLALISRNLSDLKAVFGNYDQDRVIMIKGDVAVEENVRKIVLRVNEKFKRIDVLINNAGQFLDKPLEQITKSEFDNIVETNIKGIYLMSKAVLPVMKKQKNGLILNIGSKISHNTNIDSNKVLYAMTKYAVEGFSFALNKELKPFGVRVSCLMPATVNTFISRKAKEYMSPYRVGQIISMIIKFDDIDFEGIIFKSKYQNI